VILGASIQPTPGFSANIDNPAWKPSGKRIAFASDGSIYTIKPDGKGLDRVTFPTGNQIDSRPDW
jgi:Tol biopolymer transport system component